MRVVNAGLLICFLSTTIWAQDAQTDEATSDQETTIAETSPNNNPGLPLPVPQAPQPPQPPPTASPYTHAYEVRRDIHKYASFATLPLFATEFALGQSLFNDENSTDSKRGIHAAVGTGIVGLFVLDTVTGGWNLWQSRHEKNHRTPRIIHSALMIASNAGFVATAAITPSHHNTSTFDHDKSLHRNLAVASIGIGTAGYLLMLFGRH